MKKIFKGCLVLIGLLIAFVAVSAFLYEPEEVIFISEGVEIYDSHGVKFDIPDKWGIMEDEALSDSEHAVIIAIDEYKSKALVNIYWTDEILDLKSRNTMLSNGVLLRSEFENVEQIYQKETKFLNFDAYQSKHSYNIFGKKVFNTTRTFHCEGRTYHILSTIEEQAKNKRVNDFTVIFDSFECS